MVNDNDKVIRDAQYRKGLSIAFFNATNAAIELAKVNGMAGVLDPKKFITDTRNWFLEEHKSYYATVIANVGANYIASETIEKIQKAKTIGNLKDIWLGLSADERADDVIIKVKDQLKKKLSNEKA